MVGDLDRFAALSDLGEVTAGVLAQLPHPYLFHVLHGSTPGSAGMSAVRPGEAVGGCADARIIEAVMAG
jgi:hypothetical protein